mmetsp:Transcript_22882/g.74542  ORF Transcript_22882/g.74542 Transcript_22882/m.74542 type:complete len:225 (+) Transcript_22882:301-975(+)
MHVRAHDQMRAHRSLLLQRRIHYHQLRIVSKKGKVDGDREMMDVEWEWFPHLRRVHLHRLRIRRHGHLWSAEREQSREGCERSRSSDVSPMIDDVHIQAQRPHLLPGEHTQRFHVDSTAVLERVLQQSRQGHSLLARSPGLPFRRAHRRKLESYEKGSLRGPIRVRRDQLRRRYSERPSRAELNLHNSVLWSEAEARFAEIERPTPVDPLLFRESLNHERAVVQ